MTTALKKQEVGGRHWRQAGAAVGAAAAAAEAAGLTRQRTEHERGPARNGAGVWLFPALRLCFTRDHMPVRRRKEPGAYTSLFPSCLSHDALGPSSTAPPKVA